MKRRPIHLDLGARFVVACGKNKDRVRYTDDLAQVQCSTCYVAGVGALKRKGV